METSNQIQSGVGVIIARFQVHELHKAHIELIDTVLSKHKKVIVILGVASISATKRNPLDFRARYLMLHEYYGDKITVIPMSNRAVDQVWSDEIERRIREVAPHGEVILYGSRDSFIPHYKGHYKVHELESKTLVSGTEIRKNVSEEVLSDPKFRAGIIYALYNTYPAVYPTVDVAIIRDTELLLGRKPHEQKFRFIGGFVDPRDESEIITCRREVMEETCCVVDDFEFVCSTRVDDLRYRDEESKIMTHFYIGYFQSGQVRPADDISELKWVGLDHLEFVEVVEEHKPLLNALIQHLAKKNAKNYVEETKLSHN